MSRRINSFGYRLGVVHFWQLQRETNLFLKPFIGLSKLNMVQIVNTLFFHFGYNSLLSSIKYSKGKLIIYVNLLKPIIFDDSNKSILKKECLLFKKNYFYLFEKLLQLIIFFNFFINFFLFFYFIFHLLLKLNKILVGNFIIINFYLCMTCLLL